MPELILDAEGALHVDSFYLPFPKQAQIHTSPARNLLSIGGNGSGKSFCLLGEALYNCLEYPGSNSLLLRRDYPELEKGLILDFKNTVPKEIFRYNDQKHIVTFYNGSKLFFGHLQNQSEKSLSQYLSSAFIFIGIDELGQFSYEAWDFLSSRNRVNSGCKVNAQGRMPYCRMAGATNPLGPGYGWIKRLWIDHKPVIQLGEVRLGKDGIYYRSTHGGEVPVFNPKDWFYVHSTVLDNPRQIEKDPEYISKLMRLAPALMQKALYGDLNSISGQYFSNFSYERHILSLPRDRERIEWQSWQPRWISLDWGLAHHTAVYWHTRAPVKNLEGVPQTKVVTYRELVVNETNSRDLGKLIAAATPEDERKMIRFAFLSPERFNRVGDTQHTIADEIGGALKANGLPLCSRANDRRVDGAVFMYNLLDSGEWMILDSCPQLIESLESRVRDEKNLEDVLKLDDLGDDCYDGARYGLLSMLAERGKPDDVKLKEKLATIPDHTSRMIYAYEQKLKQDAKQSAIKPKIMPRWAIRQNGR